MYSQHKTQLGIRETHILYPPIPFQQVFVQQQKILELLQFR